MESVIEKIIRECIVIDDMQFGFMSGHGATHAIFIVRQFQEKFLDKNKNLSFAFIDPENPFNRVQHKVLGWPVVGVPEWINVFVQPMYNDAKSKVRLNVSYSNEFEIKSGVYQGLVLSPLLFIVVLEALSRKFHTSFPGSFFMLMIFS